MADITGRPRRCRILCRGTEHPLVATANDHAAPIVTSRYFARLSLDRAAFLPRGKQVIGLGTGVDLEVHRDAILLVALAWVGGRVVADDHMPAEDRKSDFHDQRGLLGRPRRLAGGRRQVAEAQDGTDDLGLKSRPVEVKCFLSYAGEGEPGGDTSLGVERGEGGVASLLFIFPRRRVAGPSANCRAKRFSPLPSPAPKPHHLPRSCDPIARR